MAPQRRCAMESDDGAAVQNLHLRRGLLGKEVADSANDLDRRRIGCVVEHPVAGEKRAAIAVTRPRRELAVHQHVEVVGTRRKRRENERAPRCTRRFVNSAEKHALVIDGWAGLRLALRAAAVGGRYRTRAKATFGRNALRVVAGHALGAAAICARDRLRALRTFGAGAFTRGVIRARIRARVEKAAIVR